MDICDEEVEIKIEYNEHVEQDPLRLIPLQNHDSHETESNDSKSNIVSSNEGAQADGKEDNLMKIVKSCKDNLTNDWQNTAHLNEAKHATWERELSGNSERYLCKYCDLTYMTVQTLRHHVKLKHPDQAKELKVSVIKNKRNSKQKCHICQRRFKSTIDLKTHIKDHTVDAKYFCSYCNANFSCSKELNDHIYLKHKKYTDCTKLKYCHVCGYRTLKKSHFIQHVSSHSMEKSLTCKFCDYSTNRRANLVIHERIHTNYKPFKCDYGGCDYECAAKSALKSHQLKHEPDKNMLYCDKCCYKTVYRQSLRKHSKSHSNNSIKLKLF